jgi:hypothetical protein
MRTFRHAYTACLAAVLLFCSPRGAESQAQRTRLERERSRLLRLLDDPQRATDVVRCNLAATERRLGLTAEALARLGWDERTQRLAVSRGPGCAYEAALLLESSGHYAAALREAQMAASTASESRAPAIRQVALRLIHRERGACSAPAFVDLHGSSDWLGRWILLRGDDSVVRDACSLMAVPLPGPVDCATLSEPPADAQRLEDVVVWQDRDQRRHLRVGGHCHSYDSGMAGWPVADELVVVGITPSVLVLRETQIYRQTQAACEGEDEACDDDDGGTRTVVVDRATGFVIGGDSLDVEDPDFEERGANSGFSVRNGGLYFGEQAVELRDGALVPVRHLSV